MTKAEQRMYQKGYVAGRKNGLAKSENRLTDIGTMFQRLLDSYIDTKLNVKKVLDKKNGK